MNKQELIELISDELNGIERDLDDKVIKAISDKCYFDNYNIDGYLARMNDGANLKNLDDWYSEGLISSDEKEDIEYEADKIEEYYDYDERNYFTFIFSETDAFNVDINDSWSEIVEKATATTSTFEMYSPLNSVDILREKSIEELMDLATGRTGVKVVYCFKDYEGYVHCTSDIIYLSLIKDNTNE